MHEAMCQHLEQGEGRYCDAANIEEDFNKFGRRQVEVEFEEDYRLYVPETAECQPELTEMSHLYRELALKHSWMGMILDPKLEWAKHMRDDDSEDQCEAMFCAEFKNGGRLCSESVGW